VFLAFSVFLTGNHFLISALPIFLSRLGSSERKIGVLVGIFGIASLVFQLVRGKALLRYSIMMAGALLSVLSLPSSIVFPPFWPIFVVRVLQGIAYASSHTDALAHSVGVVPLTYRCQQIAYFMLVPNLATAIAAPLGMLLMNQYSSIVCFLFSAGLSLCAFFLPWKVSQREKSVPNRENADRGSFFLEWKIIVPALTSFLWMFVFGVLIVFFPLYAVQSGVTNPGLFFSTNVLMIISAKALAERILDAYDNEKMISPLISLSTVAMVIPQPHQFGAGKKSQIIRRMVVSDGGQSRPPLFNGFGCLGIPVSCAFASLYRSVPSLSSYSFAIGMGTTISQDFSPRFVAAENVHTTRCRTYVLLMVQNRWFIPIEFCDGTPFANILFQREWNT
jgi:predicted MFS family arabinose efflux permease